MDEKTLSALLSGLKLGNVRYAPSLGSTNAVAGEWLANGAPDLALVAAGEQTAGRGQSGRAWQSPAGSSLAFSIILRSGLHDDAARLPRLTALGALAVCTALENRNLTAQIKWPNDVLLAGCKVAGILAEAVWTGSHLDGVVLGIGVNVHPDAVTQARARERVLRYPAISVEEAAGQPIDRWDLLVDIVKSLLQWREKLNLPAFLHAWEQALAFRGEPIQVTHEIPGQSSPVTQVGILAGLAEDGALLLRTPEAGFGRSMSEKSTSFRLLTG